VEPGMRRRVPSMKRAAIAEFFGRLAAARPAPTTELGFEDPFTLLVAVVLSAQATDVGVNKATPALFAAADTPAKMLALGETPLAVELALETRVPAPYRRHAHHWLILHGRYVCKARKPDCLRCVVNDLCAYKAKTTVEAPAMKT